MITALYRLLLGVFGKLPRGVRRRVVRVVAPSFTVGAICVIERSDGQICLIQQRYRRRWGLPGGLLSRREAPERAAVREVREEIGLDVELIGSPTVVVEPVAQRVDIVFRAAPRDDAVTPSVVPTSPEISAVAWFSLGDLPEMQDETVEALRALGLLGVADAH